MAQITFRPWFYKIAPLLIWLLLVVLPLFTGPGNMPADMRKHFLVHTFQTNIMTLALFYCHTYLVYPLLGNKKQWLYFVALALLLTIYVLLFKWLVTPFMPHQAFDNGPHGVPQKQFDHEPPLGFFPVMSIIITLLCSFCYRLILDQAERKALIKEREMIHLRTELNFLRSQISPHFLFNVLNSMIALVRRKSDQLEPIIMQLSRLMRYMLYETDDQPVPLEKEIAYLKSYIELQSFRFGKNILVDIKFPDLDGLNYSLAPMLLIPFVENAFKHGTGMTERPVIVISLELKEPKRVCFRVVNEISDVEVSKDEQSGIGLTNVKRRLELLYPNRHHLYISKAEHVFIAELNIDL